jgi:hypothetical protein
MTTHAYHVLRIGLGLVFLLIGWMIWKNPELWGSFVQPWAQELMFGPVGYNDISVRDFGLFAGCVAIVLHSWGKRRAS